jgi:Glycosyltransferase
MNVLILHKPFNEQGGVGGLFYSLKKHLPDNIDSLEIGSRENEKLFSMVLRFVKDNIVFMCLIKKKHYDLIHLNLIFDFKSSVREGLFLLLAKNRCKKIIIYIHGWDDKYENKLNGLRRWIFCKVFGLCDLFIVLDKKRGATLRAWAFEQPMKLQFTAVDNDLLNGFDNTRAIIHRQSIQPFKILFLSRILKEKGIYETIDAISIIQKKGRISLGLIVAGDGQELEKAKQYAFEKKIEHLKFTGYVRGNEKIDQFKDAFLYIFPSSYGEGMPISVLEAMAFGLPVITRFVGGLGDFFQNGKHGFITESLAPEQFAGYIEKLCQDRTLYEEISRFNYNYAQQHLMASRVAEELLGIYSSLLA